MSLINDMLRDLDERRKHEQQGKTFSEVPVAVRGKNSSQNRWWIWGSVFLFLGAIVWLVISFLPALSQDVSEKVVNVQPAQQTEKGSALESLEIDTASQLPTEQQVAATPLSPAAEKSGAADEVEDPVTKLLGMVVNEGTTRSSLMFNFSDLPQYRLAKGDDSPESSELVISLSGVQLDDAFEVPELGGKLLKRVNLQPQQERLQLLVDLGSRAEVGSYELKKGASSGYTLQIDINETPSLAASMPENAQKTKAVQQMEAEIAEPKSEKQVAVIQPKSMQNDETSHLSISKNRRSPDKEAFQSGLELMRQGKFEIAEQRFATALEINPKHVQARVQLVTALLQQNKLAQAQAQMREGLSKTPRSLQLRKMYARYLLGQKHTPEAIEVLLAQPFPAAAQDLEYHALLAALLQETGQFKEAAQIYAKLLQLRPETALWWFGLAVSMDQTGDFEQARNGYRRALALPGLSVDVQKYIQDRLQVL